MVSAEHGIHKFAGGLVDVGPRRAAAAMVPAEEAAVYVERAVVYAQAATLAATGGVVIDKITRNKAAVAGGVNLRSGLALAKGAILEDKVGSEINTDGGLGILEDEAVEARIGGGDRRDSENRCGHHHTEGRCYPGVAFENSWMGHPIALLASGFSSGEPTID